MTTQPTPTHSPLPWEVRKGRGVFNVVQDLGDHGEALIARVYGEGNAALIVTAVNSHAALVEALRGMVTLCPHCFGMGVRKIACTLCGDSTFDHVCNDSVAPCDIKRCVDARAALALVARGGQPE